MLVDGQAHDAARDDDRRRRGHGQKRAVETLDVAEEARLQIAFIRHPDPHAAAGGPPLRIVDLEDLAVAAFFAEVAGAEERLDAIGRAVVELHVDVLERDRRVVVDDAALARGHDREAACIEHAPFDRRAQLAPHVAAEEIDLGTVVVAVLRLELDGPARGPAADDVDDAA